MEQKRSELAAMAAAELSAGKEIEHSPQLHNVVVVDRAIRQVRFGRYQWRMFVTCGFDFLLDSVRRCHFHLRFSMIADPCRCFPGQLDWCYHKS